MQSTKSTGPLSARGKRNSAKNALKYGLTSRTFITEEEDARYDHLVRELTKEHGVTTITATLLVERLASTKVRMERLEQVERVLFEEARRESCDFETIFSEIDAEPEHKRLYMEDYFPTGFEKKDTMHLMHVMNRQRDLMSELMALRESGKRLDNYASLQLHVPSLHARLELASLFIGCSISHIFESLSKHGQELLELIALTTLMDDIPSKQSSSFGNQETDSSEMDISGDHINRFVASLTSKLLENMHISLIHAQIKLKQHSLCMQAMPDDNKMLLIQRYSTTMNNQFSKALGELLHVLYGRDGN